MPMPISSEKKLSGLFLSAALLSLCLQAGLHAEVGQDTAQRSPVPADQVQSVASTRVLLWHQTVPGSAPCTGAELWFTQDRGRTWQQWSDLTTRTAQSDQSTNPITFDAPTEGLYGFYIVLHNQAGPSSPPPAPGTAPQTWALVDRTAPIVQILAFRPDDHFKVNREIHIRWNARDDNLPDRPVRLHYRSEQTRAYHLVADLLAETGSYRWTMPEDASGQIEIKCSATDRAGNTGRSVVDLLRIDPQTRQVVRSLAKDLEPRQAGDPPGTVPTDPHTIEPGLPRWQREPPAAITTVDSQAARRAQSLYDRGTWHRLRGEHAMAMLRYRDALKADPELLAARNDLGGLLFVKGDHKAAEAQFRGVLAKDQRHLAALKGLALVQATRHDYRSAHDTLQKLLLLDPNDADAWLHLGDVAMFMGRRQPAWEAWSKVAVIDDASDELKLRAGKRLAIYQKGKESGIQQRRTALSGDQGP